MTQTHAPTRDKARSRYIVPDGMIEAAREATEQGIPCIDTVLEAAVRWLAENPIVPTSAQAGVIVEATLGGAATVNGIEQIKQVCVEWQRRMFLAPEPPVPDAVRDLINCCHSGSSIAAEDVRKFILDAYQRGKESRG